MASGGLYSSIYVTIYTEVELFNLWSKRSTSKPPRLDVAQKSKFDAKFFVWEKNILSY